MFKRQFYAVDHADNDDASSSDSSVNTNSDDDSAHDQDDDASSPEEATPGSNDFDSDSEGGGEPPESESEDEEWNTFRDRNVKVVQSIDSSHFLLKKPTTTETADDESGEDEAATESGGDRVVLRVGGVLKCRYCVKILCLSDESMKAHLLSKRHARSLKQLASGKLKVQLDSDGNEEEEGETHAERLERIRSIAEEKVVPVKRKAKSGRPRQRKRAKQKPGKAERALQKSAKQRSE